MSECKIYFADIDDWRIGSTFAEKLSNEIEDGIYHLFIINIKYL